MTYANNINRFFAGTYNNLGRLAFSPISWSCVPDSGVTLTPNFNKILIATVLSPVLVPATGVTVAVSIGLAVAAGLTHVFALMLAPMLDALTPAHSAPVSTRDLTVEPARAVVQRLPSAPPQDIVKDSDGIPDSNIDQDPAPLSRVA